MLTGGCLLSLPASASGASHTLKFTAKNKANHSFGKHGGGAFDKDVNAAHKVIGFDVTTFTGSRAADVALALQGGFIYGTLAFDKAGGLTGDVTGGTGPYAHAKGTIAGQQTGKNTTQVTVTYHG